MSWFSEYRGHWEKGLSNLGLNSNKSEEIGVKETKVVWRKSNGEQEEDWNKMHFKWIYQIVSLSIFYKISLKNKELKVNMLTNVAHNLDIDFLYLSCLVIDCFIWIVYLVVWLLISNISNYC